VHTNVYSSIGTSVREVYSYFITFTDDFSRYGYVFLMRHKSESLERFKEFQNEVENQLEKMIKALRLDRGVSERRNRTLLDMVRSMMSRTKLLLSFWGYALKTVIFTLNIVPTKSVDKTPYDVWTERVPNLFFSQDLGLQSFC
jgi:hypothetical protein